MAVVGAALSLSVGVAPAGAQSVLPQLSGVTPAGGQRGTTVELTISGTNLEAATGLFFEGAGLQVESLSTEKPAPPAAGAKSAGKKRGASGKLGARVRIAADAVPGIRSFRVLTPVGPSDAGRFVVGQWPEGAEREPNNSPERAQAVSFPIVVNGQISPAEDLDCYRFHARAGQTLVFEVLAARLDSPLDAILSLQDERGRELAVNDDTGGMDALLVFPVPQEGDYCLLLRDLRNQGGGSHHYRLTMGEIPYVTAAFPPGGPPGASVEMALHGVNLGGAERARVTLPAEARPDLCPVALPLPEGFSNLVTVAVEEESAASAPEQLEVEPNEEPSQAQLLPVPGVVYGRIYGAQGSPPSLPAEARDGPMPRSTEVDCYRFHATKGEKLILEVMARRYGSELDSLLVITDAAGKERAVNDDALGKDSRLEFTAPETGDYVARIADLQERQGPNATYRLSILPARPDFRLSCTPDRVAVGPGGHVLLNVAVQRLNGFDGEVALQVEDLPAGVSLLGTTGIRPGRKEVNLVLTAAPGAMPQAVFLRVTGAATIDGKSIRRTAQALEETARKGDNQPPRPARLPVAAVTLPPDVVLTAPTDPLTLAPGKSLEVKVRVERQEGVKGKISLSALDLPDGVTAANVDVAEDKREATIILKAEEKAASVETQILLAAKLPGENSRAALQVSAPIPLKVGRSVER
jgi:hypothetical protein